MFQLVNKEMFWVVTEIVNESNLVKRMKIMKHFIKIASKFVFFIEKRYMYLYYIHIFFYMFYDSTDRLHMERLCIYIPLALSPVHEHDKLTP